VYDPLEVDLSFKLIKKLKQTLTQKWGLMGGWAVFFHVSKEYHLAFGKEYLKSRDIDICIFSKDSFLDKISEIGFRKSAYSFRYEMIYDREKSKFISEREAKNKHIFNLIYIFLDVFSPKKIEGVNSWVIKDLSQAKIENIDNFPVIDVNSLLKSKVLSFFEREKIDKEMKDACDIFALLFYSKRKIKKTREIREAVNKILTREDLTRFIAENVLGDSIKEPLVIAKLKNYLKP